MSRARKLLIVGLVLALGVVLAWPFRSAGPQFVPSEPRTSTVAPAREAVTQQPSPVPADKSKAPAVPAERQIPATMASTAELTTPTTAGPGFDVENHPALAEGMQSVPPAANPFVKPQQAMPTTTARPAYATGDQQTEQADWPEEVIHIVQNGDTLEKLAKRYLGDAGRALELFDLNRQQLTNPHLLPIGAELRIPVPVRRDLD